MRSFYVIEVRLGLDRDDYSCDPLDWDQEDLRAIITARWPDEMKLTIREAVPRDA